MRYLPRGYAKLASDKLNAMGYVANKAMVYYNKYCTDYQRKKLIDSVLCGLAVNEYQRLKRLNQRVIKEEQNYKNSPDE